MAPRQSLDDIADFYKVLYYGPAGRGKTTNSASMANLGPMIHIDAESGLKKAALRKRGIEISNIQIHNEITYEAIDELIVDIRAELEDNPGSILGASWDSVTETQKLFLEDIVRIGVAKADRKGIERDEFAVYKEDWGVNTEQMRRLIRRFRDLPCHVAICALERRDQDDDGTVRYGPSVTPALQDDLTGYMDVICHVMVEEVPGWGEHGEMFLGQFRAGGKYITKDRFNVLPTRMVDPTMERIILYLNGEMDAESDPVTTEAREALAAAREAAKPRRKDESESGDDEDATPAKPTPTRRRGRVS